MASNSKTDEFSKKFRRWGGGYYFQSKKFIILQILAVIDDTLVMNFGKNMIFKGRLELFRKFVRIGVASLKTKAK